MDGLLQGLPVSLSMVSEQLPLTAGEVSLVDRDLIAGHAAKVGPYLVTSAVPQSLQGGLGRRKALKGGKGIQ